VSTINIFRSLTDDTYETIHVEENKPIKEAVKADFTNAIISVNGFQKDENYILKEGDLCTIRLFPEGSGADWAAGWGLGLLAAVAVLNFWNPGGWAMGVIVLGGAVGGAVLVGTLSANGYSLTGWLGSLFEQQSADLKSPDALAKIPQLRGAKNQSNYNKPIPIVMGKHLYTPMYIGMPYTEIGGEDGEDQYFNALFLLGYSKLQVTDIKLGILGDLCSNKGGNAKDDGLLVFDENPAYEEDDPNDNPKLELRQGASEVGLYPQKVFEEQLSIELTNFKADGKTKVLEVPRFTAKNPMKVQVEFTFGGGLIKYNDKMEKQNTTVGIKVEWRQSPSDPQGWREFGSVGSGDGIIYDPVTHTTTITRRKSKVMRFIAQRTFTYTEAKGATDRTIELRIQRTSEQDINSTRISDTVHLTAVRTWCFDYEKSSVNNLVPQAPMIKKYRDKTCRLGFRIRASGSAQGTLDALNCIVQSYGRTWDGADWSDSESLTQNPASIALKILQSPSLGNKKYPDEMLDKNSFGAFYEWCNERNFTCNGVLTSKKKIDDVLAAVLGTGRAMRILNGNRYGILIDKPRNAPVTILNSQNVLEATNQKAFADMPDGLCVNFINEKDGYSQNEIYAMKDGTSETWPEAVIETIDMPFITNYNQIFRNAKYQLACRYLRPEIWNRKVSIHGYLVALGDRVSIQDDTILVGIGEGAVITGVLVYNDEIIGIRTDGQFDVTDISKNYGVKIAQYYDDKEPVIGVHQVAITSPGVYNEFLFSNPIPPTETNHPNTGDVVAFGIYEQETTDALCFGKKDNGDGTFNLTLVPYQEGIYTVDSGTVPEFDSKITPPQEPYSPKSYDPTPATKDELYETIENIISGTADVGRPDALTGLRAAAGKDTIHITWNPLGNGLANAVKHIRIEIKKTANGAWQTFEVRGGDFVYDFNRAADGYPEKSDLAAWRIRAKAVSIYGQESVEYAPDAGGLAIDTSGYGTWLPAPPALVIATSGRTINAAAPSQTWYGAAGCEFQISKPVAGTPWYAPAMADTDTVYSVADSWKGAEGGVYAAAAQITQQLPLEGQDANTPKDTAYKYRARSLTKAYDGSVLYRSAWGAEAAAIAKGTGVRDVVAEAIGEAQLKNGAVTNGKIEDATIDYEKFNPAVKPPRKVTALPANPYTGYVRGDTVILMSGGGANDEKLYRLVNPIAPGTAGWSSAVDGLDVLPNTVQPHSLNTLVKNVINPMTDGLLDGWALRPGCSLVDDETAGFKVLQLADDTAGTTKIAISSNTFDVLPDTIYVVKFGIECLTGGLEPERGIFIGIGPAQGNIIYRLWWFNPAAKKWRIASDSTNNPYFVHDYRVTGRTHYVSYILGKDVNLQDVPAPEYTDDSPGVYCIQLLATTACYFRDGANLPTAPRAFKLICPQVYRLGSERIISDNIEARSLAGDRMAAKTLTANEIMARTLTADEVALRTLTGDLMAMNTITTKNLAVGDFTNLATVNENIPASMLPAGFVFGQTLIDGGYIVKAAAGNEFLILTDFPEGILRAGDEYYFEFSAKAAAGTNGVMGAWGYSSINRVDGVVVGAIRVAEYISGNLPIAKSEQRFTGAIKITSTVASVKYILFGFDDTGTKQQVYFKNVIIRKKNAGEMIIDGSITASKIKAGAVETDKLAAKAVTGDKIDANTVNAENLNVLAKNVINPFVDGTKEGWTTGSTVVDVDGLGYVLKPSEALGKDFQSNGFTVLPDDIYRFTFGVESLVELEEAQGLYIGLSRGQVFDVFEYSFTDSKWLPFSTTNDAYFLWSYRAAARKYYTTYILGSRVNISDVPAPIVTDTDYRIFCLQLTGTDTTCRIRSGYNDGQPPDAAWYFIQPQVYRIGSSKITAENIITRALSAVSASMGRVTGDGSPNDSQYKLVLSDGFSGNENKKGTFLLGAATDSAYLRRWWDGNVWHMAIKLATFIVDSIASNIFGRFRVFRTGQNSDTDPPVFDTNPGADPQGQAVNHASSEFRGAFRIRKSNNPLFPGYNDTVFEALPNGYVNIPDTLAAKYLGDVISAGNSGKIVNNLSVLNNFDGQGITYLLISKLDGLDITEEKKGFVGVIYSHRGGANGFNITGMSNVICTKAYNNYKLSRYGNTWDIPCVVSYQSSYYLAIQFPNNSTHQLTLEGHLFREFVGSVVQGATVVKSEQEWLVTSGNIFAQGDVTIAGTTPSTSPNTGALTVAGGVGIAGALNVGDTTESNNKDTGALIVEGGVGIEKNLNVGGTFKTNAMVLPVLSTDPSYPVTGQIWVRS
jgi:hypothetical protein